MKERNINYLHEHRVIYKNIPKDVSDMVETSQYYYYPTGTKRCYTLFASDHKISSYKALLWTYLVLKYLNPNKDLKHVFEYIADEDNGYIYFNIRDLSTLISDVLASDNEPPVNKTRRVVFKQGCKLTSSQKISIANSLIHRKKITCEAIEHAIIEIASKGEKVTYKNISNILNCSVKSVSRNITSKLKEKISEAHRRHLRA